jgi:hypothetical protein
VRAYTSQGGENRLWFEPTEIDEIMEGELRRSNLWPPDDNPVVDVEAFLDGHLRVDLDQYADLPSDILGQTEFHPGAPRVQINRDLTGSAMDSEWPTAGIQGRWRATLAHEGAHVVLHRSLFDSAPDQEVLFEVESREPTLMRCLKRDVAPGSTRGDWREVQANRGMAALLMPRELFGRRARQIRDAKPKITTPELTRALSGLFQVSNEAARIRVDTLGLAGGPDLFSSSAVHS